MTHHVGIDVGGTFTDTFALDVASGEVILTKVPSTPPNQAKGFMDGLRKTQIHLGDISWLVHGTTVGTNATLERNGARCGMITTKGFRDIIELGRRERRHLYGLDGEFRPLIERRHRYEVTERIASDGTVLTPLDEDELQAAINALLEDGVEGVLVGFMNSYANSVHEDRAVALLRDVWPKPYITSSAEILREFREFERFGTAALNAYIQPLIHRYLTHLESDLEKGGLGTKLVVMQTNGGVMSVAAACRRSVNTVMSGPAAGVIAASHISDLAGEKNVITCDMGGTSFDVGLIVNGAPVVTNDRDLDFGIPMRIPVVDIHTVGAGGGSIAYIGHAGILQVGPRSAGAVPGPIAYGRGGIEPTVTDANVLLGRLGSDGLIAVSGGVDMTAIRAAFARLGKALELDEYEAAEATLRVVNDAMAGAMRLVSLQRGHDPRDFVMFAYGGAGPLHAGALALELGIPRILVPYAPGITCAVGCIVADVQHDFVQTVNRFIADIEEAELVRLLTAQRTEGEAMLKRDQVPVDQVNTKHFADMQYEGQTYTLRVEIESAKLEKNVLAEALADGFRTRFRIDLSGFRPKLINLRTTVVGRRPSVDLHKIVGSTRKAANADSAIVGMRRVCFDGRWIETPLYDRMRLPSGSRIEGPAIFNQMDTTTVAEPGSVTTVDQLGNLLIEVTR